MTKQMSPLTTLRRNLFAPMINVAIMSGAINLLLLTGPIFMLQVYDRVLPSRSEATLIVMILFVAVLIAFHALFDYLRASVLSKTGLRIEKELAPEALKRTQLSTQPGSPKTSLKDIALVRQFMTSSAPATLFDLPWVPIYLIFIFILHPALGYLTLGGAVLVCLLTVVNEFVSANALIENANAEGRKDHLAQIVQNHQEPIRVMGLFSGLQQRWIETNNAAQFHEQRAHAISNALRAITRGFRLLLQSAILGLGVYLAIHQQMSAGGIIAASIVSGRALAPIDQAIASWQLVSRTRQAWRRLQDAFLLGAADDTKMELPIPQGHVSVNGVTFLGDQIQQNKTALANPVLFGINFELAPGDALGVIGASASGKSTLARLLVGAIGADRGSVTLDRVRLDQWDPAALGEHIGYLPQSLQLLPGTIRENISRFNPNAQDLDVIEAAKLVGIHDTIANLPDGYNTRIDQRTHTLSGGQSQQIALARAVYRTPALIVLDEPNSGLDTDGDRALNNCIATLRLMGSTVIVMAHRPSAIEAVNKVLVLSHGRQAKYGKPDDVLERDSTRPSVQLVS